MPLPADRDVLFLVCEDARLEVGGKVSLLGLYTGGEVVILAQEAEVPVIGGLSLFFSINGGEGPFTGRVELVDPNANPVANHNVGQVQKTPNGSANIVMHFSPFPAIYGTYQVRLHLDEQAYERSFRITRRNPA